MAWHLTEARRDAVILDLLGKALRALDEDNGGGGRREAHLWIDRAAEVIRNLAVFSSSPGEQARLDAVEAVLERIAAHLERDGRHVSS